jgi:hypothetical protein
VSLPEQVQGFRVAVRPKKPDALIEKSAGSRRILAGKRKSGKCERTPKDGNRAARFPPSCGPEKAHVRIHHSILILK